MKRLPVALASLQLLLYFMLLGYDYWRWHFNGRMDVPAMIQRDLVKPLDAEGSWLCHSTAIYHLSLEEWINLPVVFLREPAVRLVVARPSCDLWLQPRGQLFTALLVPWPWWWAGVCWLRLARGEHRRPEALAPQLIGCVAAAAAFGAAVLLLLTLALEPRAALRLLGPIHWFALVAAAWAPRYSANK